MKKTVVQNYIKEAIRNWGQIIYEFVSHGKDFNLYSEGIGQLL